MAGSDPSLQEGIAIIGMAARLPGAVTVDAFWNNLIAGAPAIRRSSAAELLAAGFDPALLEDPRLVPAFGVLDGADRFDAGFFGYPAARAEMLDPQQRLLLECAWHALEDAGWGPGSHDATVGTYLAMTASTWETGDSRDLGDGFFALTSRDKDYAATRVSYKLDLTGPSLMVQTACSGSLAAVHLAVEALLGGQCDMAIAGGCSITLPQGGYRQASGLMLSASGICRAFDAAADGAVPGNGLGVVVLKPLGQALADGDTVWAVIRGTALNNDGGHKADYLAPSVQGQMRVIGEALAVAGVAPSEIGYVECHGTGTALGDPVEIRALAQAFAAAGGGRRTAIGSVKSNIGHLNAASGIAGLIKTVLAIRHGKLPPSLGFTRPNAEIDFAATPFHVNTAVASWPDPAAPRRAGVSSFGFGGTNVHVVLEQAPPQPAAAAHPGPVILPLSAKTPAALDRAAQALADWIEARPDLDPADIGYTLAVGRQAFEHRRVVIGSDRAWLAAALRAGEALAVETAAPALTALGRTWLDGAAVAWGDTLGARRRVGLPGYPFEPTRYRRAAPRPVPAAAAPAPDRLVPWLQALFGEILSQDAATLDPASTYERFGVDSLMVGTITGELRRHFPDLRSTVLFEHNTLVQLAAHLAATAPDRVAGIGPTDGAVAMTAGAIAVVGLAGTYPGAPDIDALWDNLAAGRRGIGEVPPDRWDWRRYFDPAREDRSYSRWGGFIADVDKFDPLVFGIAPREAKLIDPQQRLFLEAAWAVLEDAGYTRAGLRAASGGRDVGVFVGVMNQGWRLLGRDAAAAGHVVQGNHWSVANRVSYAFDFRGPSLAVDTGCSASLTALHLACESLRRGECGAAIAGGVNLILHPVQQLELARTGVLSHGDRCSVFGAGADGFVQGEGVGAALLKPLDRALADGDHIYGVILGSAINAGGKTSGYTVPNPGAQTAVIRQAIAASGVDASAIGYVECHGTGTALGDPIEIAGLADALPGAESCRLGSIKSSIGHLESAAGIAGLTKLLLQLSRRTLVPSLDADPPNPRIDFAGGRFRVQRRTEPWPEPAGAAKRCGGLSSFGAGGANAHIVVEEPPPVSAGTSVDRPVLVPLSARTRPQLVAVARRLAARLDQPPALADLAWTLAVGREAMDERVCFVADSIDTLRRALAAFVTADGRSVPMPVTSGTGLAAALATRDLPRLAEFWCAGESVPWEELFAGRPRRVRLPTYPFLREHYWLPEVAEAAPPTGHPLLGPALPVLAAEARWRVTLAADHPLLACHLVGGTPMLPGVASLELASEAARQLGRRSVGFRNIAWQRPLPAPAGLAAELVMRTAGDGLVFELTSDAGVHVRGDIVAEPAAIGDPVDLAALEARCPQHFGQDEIYRRLSALGLDYRGPFRAIRHLATSREEAVARVALAAEARLEPCALPPGLLDAAFQAAAMLVFQRPEAPRLLPFSVASIRFFGPLPRQGLVHARLLTAPDRLDFVRFDLAILDEQGRTVAAFQDLAGRIDASARPIAEPETAPPSAPESGRHTATLPVAGSELVPPAEVSADWFFAPVWTDLAARPGPVPTGGILVAAPGAEAEALSSVRTALPDAIVAEDEAAWQAALAAEPEPGRVVFLCPSAPAEGDAALMALFRLLKALRRARGGAPLHLALLSRGAAGFPGGTGSAWPAAMMALARVAGQEWRDWQIVPADLERWQDAPAALADPGDPLGREIAWRGGRRRVRALAPAAAPAPVAPAFRAQGHYVLLGGGGGIGLELALYLSRRYQARLTLIGRRAPTPAQRERLDRIAAAGGEVLFLAADATEAEPLAEAIAGARRRFGPVRGAIHAAIVMEDRALDSMTEATFRAGLAVKALGVQALAAAVADDPLDWLALFSSVNSFAANAGQANYVAGCAFKDAFGETLAAGGVPVRVINWGYWGEVGRVADEVYRARLERRGVLPIRTAEGLAAIEQVLGDPRSPVTVLKADERALHRLGVVEPAAPATDPLARLQARVGRHVADQAGAMAGAWAEYAALDALSRRLLVVWASGSGLLPEAPESAAAIIRRLGIVERHRRLFLALLDMLEREGVVGRDGDRYRRAPAAGDGRYQAERVASDMAAFERTNPALAPHLRLIETCIAGYDEILRGAVLATEVMFPNSSMALVEGIYRGNRLSDFCSGVVAAAVREAVGPGPARLLEIGAGTGGTTRTVLPALDGIGGLEYIYTDVSLAFAKFGKREFGAKYPFLAFRSLDITKPPEGQGYAAGSVDVALGANVVHATPELGQSLGHACFLLRPGGLLVLYEMTTVHDFGTLTFGLLDGWWMFRDERLPHAPLLDAAGWRRNLAAAGFAEIAIFSEPGLVDEAQFRHSVIVARKPDAAAAPSHPAPGIRDRLRRRPEEPAASAPPALVQSLRETAAAVLEMAPEDLRTDRSFADYGADSLIGVDLVAAVNARFGVSLNPTVLFSHHSVDKLAAHLAARHAVTLDAPAEIAASPAQAPIAAGDIAVIGMSGRFPGAASIEAFWANLAAGVDSVGEVPATRWDHAAIFDPEPRRPGKTYCRHGGFLDDVELFDPLFFNLSPAQAAATDPQQRLFLEEAWHALEDAGHGGEGLGQTICGVFVGTVAGDYDQRLRETGRLPDAQSFMGTAPSMLAARIAYRLNLRGPCLSIDTACSSSLVAIHLACESLRHGESDLALAGGVAVMTTPSFYLSAASAGMLSPSGRCRTLDHGADGFVPGEAVAVLVLKRLADALADGDHIQGVIRATGVNQDGASNGITAPNGAAQTELACQVYDRFGIDPATIGYVELHGTGTSLGDPIEVRALQDAFRTYTAATGFCALGSAKANIGHTLPAAGVVGLIKALLAIRHATIPPALHLDRLNPHIELEGSAFHAPTEARPWPAGLRRAAVSAFGFSGTNAHAVVEAPPAPPLVITPARPRHLAVVSAETAEALGRRLDDLALWLDRNPSSALADVCFTLGAGRAHLRHRVAVTAGSTADLAAALRAAVPGSAVDPRPPAPADLIARAASGEEPACRALAELYRAGAVIDWAALYPAGTARRLSLPTYPFARRRCWPEEPAAQIVPPELPAPPPGSNGKARPSLFAAVTRELETLRRAAGRPS
jgi:acyl transferase domain-containing protein/acyl carrier protein